MQRLSSVALSLALALAPLAREELRFKTPVGDKVTKTFEDSLSLKLEEMRVVVNGEDVPAEDLGDLQIDIDGATRVVYTDHYREGGEGQPKVLARSFDTLERKRTQKAGPEGEVEEETTEEESALEGQTVVFTWDAEEQRHNAKFDGEGADEKLLAGLFEDTDLRTFLPGKKLEKGDSWSIEPKAFRHVIDPGGELHFESEDEAQDDDDNDEQLNDNLGGEIRATFEGTREEDGAQLAVVKLECKLMTFRENETSDEPLTTVQRLDVEFKLVGELVWELASGRLVSYQLEGDARLVDKRTSNGEIHDQSVSFEEAVTLAGRATFSCSTSKAQ
jgi:hypothetical protein